MKSASERIMTQSPQNVAPGNDADRPIAAIREEDEYRKYRENRKRSRKKIRGFFGQSVQMDISTKTIEQQGLPAILQSNLPLCYFLRSLLEDMNAENLFFYLEVEQFEEHNFETIKKIKSAAMELYNAFVKSGADFELNLEAKIRDSILPKIEAGDQNCFAEAREHVVHLLVPCYSNFTLGAFYERMINELGDNATIFDKSQKHSTINVILEYIDREPSSSIVADDKAARRRRMMLREMIHSFCRTRLKCDFKDQKSTSTDSKDVSTKPEGRTEKEKKPLGDAIDYAT